MTQLVAPLLVTPGTAGQPVFPILSLAKTNGILSHIAPLLQFKFEFFSMGYYTAAIKE